MPDPTLLLRIHGRVQGVGYRWAMVGEARRLGVNGWVRNRQDGTVEALIHGPADAVARLVDWANHGPPMAMVERVDVQDGPHGDHHGFEQRATA